MTICRNCGIDYNPLRLGLCVACYRFERRTGSPRPYRGDGRKLNPSRGENHPEWKGDAACSEAKRHRAQLLYPLGKCEKCPKPATDRHHLDDDPGNNLPENINKLCRRCHMIADGRLPLFLTYSSNRPIQPPKPCRNCGRLSKPLRRGLCKACAEYQRRRGGPRTYERAEPPSSPRPL